jgi:hypothetical protein
MQSPENKTNPQIAEEIVRYIDNLHPVLEKPEVLNILKQCYNFGTMSEMQELRGSCCALADDCDDFERV